MLALVVRDHALVVGFFVAGLVLAVVEIARSRFASVIGWSAACLAVGALLLVR